MTESLFCFILKKTYKLKEVDSRFFSLPDKSDFTKFDWCFLPSTTALYYQTIVTTGLSLAGEDV